MTKRIAFLIAAVLFLATLGPTRADDQKDIQGTWKIETAVRNGQEMPAEMREKLKLEFKGEKVIFHSEKGEEPGSFKLDATKKPKTIDLKPKADSDKEVPGIYKLTGDALTICFGREDRPSAFESKEGSNVMLVTLKRDKK